MSWNTDKLGDLNGKTFLVTGANTGIGLATVEALARHGADVILACRSPEKGVAALGELRRRVPHAKVVLEQLDLARLSSVKAFSERVKVAHQRLDALINNAGVMVTPPGRTADGFETQFGTNVLGHFALTGQLLPLLLRAPSARVVTLSSVAHWYGRVNFDNLNAEKGYSKHQAYGQSKLANLLFAYELQRRLAASGAAVQSIAAHPGTTQSDLARHDLGVRLLMGLVGQSAEQGAWPSLRAATDPTVQGGDFVGPGGFGTFTGAPTVQRSSRKSRDAAAASRLWTAAQDLTGVRYL